MASNITVENVHIETYESNLRILAQQMISKVRPWVQQRSEGSEGHNWERLASQDALEKTPIGGPTGRNVATPEQGTEFDRRRSTPKTVHMGEAVEPEDIVKTLVDINSGLARIQTYGLMRAIDDECFDAATRDADDGNGGVVAFPAGQTVGNGTTPITVDLATEAIEAFLNNDVDPDEPKVVFVSPFNVRKMMQLTEVTSADYNALRPLMSGEIAQWLGCTWIPSTRLNSPAAGEVDMLMMTQKAIGLNVNEDITVRVAEDPTESFLWRVYARSTFGAVRVEDEHVVRIHVADA